MRCAGEIVIKNNTTIMEREQAALLKAMSVHKIACEEAIRFCEEVIGPDFENKAKEGVSMLSKNYYFGEEKDILNNLHLFQLKREYYTRTIHHRNGTKSRKQESTVVHTGTPIDYDTMVAYLKQHCYIVEKYNTFISIKPNPECI